MSIIRHIEGPDGEPIEVWRRRRVARTQLVSGDREVTVSTVLDVGNPEDGENYQTMVFGGVLDHDQYSYRTRANAAVGHYEVVTLARLALACTGDEPVTVTPQEA